MNNHSIYVMSAIVGLCLAGAVPSVPAEPAVPPNAVSVPGTLQTASEVLGLVGDPVRAACNTYGIPQPIEGWFGTGGNGVIERGEHNGESVDPVEVLTFLQQHAEQESEWAQIVLKLLNICGNGFAFCVAFDGALTGNKLAFCAVCCGGDTDASPYAACDGTHQTAVCKCVSG